MRTYIRSSPSDEHDITDKEEKKREDGNKERKIWRKRKRDR